MGTTLTTLQAGSNAHVLVVAIQGFPYLITNGDTAAAVTAWAGTDWSAAINGLFTQLRNEQSFNPWQPFQGGGACQLRVMPDAVLGDVLGLAMGKTSALPETEITASVNRSDTTINVKRADDFAAATSTAFIGNECFSYSSKTSTTFTVAQRGLYSPFASGNFDANHWGLEHRIATYDTYTQLVPLVTQYRREWKGAWVGVWLHAVSGGVLDTKAQAQCIYAGQISEYGDDADGSVVVHCQHVLDVIANTTIGRDQYSATVGDAIYVDTFQGILGTNTLIRGSDNNGTAFTANDLVIVSSGASGANQINAGYYTIGDLLAKMNTWFDSERVAGRLSGFHSVSIVDGTDATGAAATFLQTVTRFTVASSATCSWNFETPATIATTLGHVGGIGTAPISISGLNGGPVATYGSTTCTVRTPNPIRSVLGGRKAVSSEAGVFFDQSGYIPSQYAGAVTGSALGVFLVNGRQIILGRISGGELLDIWQAPRPAGGTDDTNVLAGYTFTIVQVYAINASFGALMELVFKSTGTAAYNSGSWDVLTSGLGLDLPGGLMSARFDSTLTALPGATLDSTMWLTKPTKLADVFGADHVLRGSHLVFRSGVLEWQVWSTPVAALATVTLTESNKAEPAGNVISQKSVSLASAEWAKPVVKILFDYNPIGDVYANTVTLQDRVAIDDQGGSNIQPYTLQVRNAGMGQTSIDNLKLLLGGTAGGDMGFVGKWIPFCSRPIRKITRSLAPTLYEAICPGDTAVVTDLFARDPATGLRGTVARPGLVLRHAASYGGLVVGSAKPDAPAGEVDVLVMPVNRAALWSPAAELDETAVAGGFTAGYNDATKTLRCEAHTNSEASEPADASNFAAGDVILITEVDPATPGAPVQWQRTIASVSGNDIVMTATLTAPAFNTALTYRITSAAYTAATTTQETKVYQAGTNGMVQSTSAAYQYALAPLSTVAPTARDHTDGCEIINTLTGYGDGAAMDTGNYKSFVRSVNNLIDHRSAHQSPAVGNQIFQGKTANVYTLGFMAKRFFGIGRYTGSIRRYAYVALWLRSNTGAAITARVTLSKNRLVSHYNTSFFAPSTPGYTWSLPYSQVTFSTSSTTWATTAEAALDLAVLDGYGAGWITVELTNAGDCRGIAQLIERERIVT